MSTDLTNPNHWRGRAEAARRDSEQMIHAESKRTMLWVAFSYDKLAERGPRGGKSSGWSPRLVEGLITTQTALPARR